MRYAQKKENRLYIPSRDKRVEVKAKPALGNNVVINEQVMNAFSFGFTRYKKAMKALSEL